jgi:hypothetical protein
MELDALLTCHGFDCRLIAPIPRNPLVRHNILVFGMARVLHYLQLKHKSNCGESNTNGIVALDNIEAVLTGKPVPSLVAALAE